MSSIPAASKCTISLVYIFRCKNILHATRVLYFVRLCLKNPIFDTVLCVLSNKNEQKKEKKNLRNYHNCS